MLRTILFALITFMTLQLSATSIGDYLTIVVKKNTEKESIAYYYPAGTTFQINNVDDDNTIIMNRKQVTYLSNGDVELIIQPTYRSTPEKLRFTDTQIQIFTTHLAAKKAGFADEPKSRKNNKVIRKKAQNDVPHNYGSYDGWLKAEQNIRPSKVNALNYNAELKFNNGITFTYIDGVVAATQNDAVIKVAGEYLIYGEKGVTKVSFNPKNGEVWYVFEGYERQ